MTDSGAQPMSILGVSDPLSEDHDPKDQYWATLPVDKLGDKLVERVIDYDLYTRTYGQLWLWRRSYYTYYKNYFRGGRMLRAGDIGQYKTLSINHYHSIVQGLLTLITSQEPAFDPQAINSDYLSQAQCKAALNILDYYSRYGHLSQKLKDVAERALLYGEGFIFLDLDPNAGSIVAVDPTAQRPIYDGEVTTTVFSPADVIRDYARQNDDRDWYILREYVNKWDEVTKFPDLADGIKGLGIDQDIQLRRFGHSLTENQDDLICRYTFVHRKTPSVPQGRIVKFYAKDVISVDSPLPFDDFPVYRIAPANQEETTFGYSVAFDLLAIQEAIDKLISIIVTNQMTFGVQNIVAQTGTKLSPQQLVDGLNLILTDMRQGIPQVLELVKTPPEIFQFIGFLVEQMQLISGLNAVSRGVAPENLKSGTALAFVQSQAIQANSGIQKSYSRLIEDVGTGYLNIVKSFPTSKRIQAISGNANRSYLASYSAEDIQNVTRVVIKSGNPLTKTTAGRIEVAQNLLQYELLKTPEEFMSIVETGQLQSLTEGSMSELLHIREENDAMRDGQPAKPLFLDNHPLHIKEHMAVINSVDIRNSNDPAVQQTIQHIQQHVQLWMAVGTAQPQLLAALGIQPPPMPMMPTPQPGGPAPSAGPIQNVADAQNPTEKKADEVKAPKPPKNAAPEAAENMRQAAANLEGARNG